MSVTCTSFEMRRNGTAKLQKPLKLEQMSVGKHFRVYTSIELAIFCRTKPSYVRQEELFKMKDAVDYANWVRIHCRASTIRWR